MEKIKDEELPKDLADFLDKLCAFMNAVLPDGLMVNTTVIKVDGDTVVGTVLSHGNKVTENHVKAMLFYLRKQMQHTEDTFLVKPADLTGFGTTVGEA